MTDSLRKLAEQAYINCAFDYARDPIGSRDWELFWKGWLNCASHLQPQAPSIDLLRDRSERLEKFTAKMEKLSFKDQPMGTYVVCLRDILDEIDELASEAKSEPQAGSERCTCEKVIEECSEDCPTHGIIAMAKRIAETPANPTQK